MSDPLDLVEVLKWVVRHLAIAENRSDARILDTRLYDKFVEAERSADYRTDVYDIFFRPSLTGDVAAYLDQVFEAWAAMITTSPEDPPHPRWLCLLLGWWILGFKVNGKSLAWRELYDQWIEAGDWTEHLFYAWIR